MLSSATAQRLKAAAEATAEIDGMAVNIAVAYGGRVELADAVLVLQRATRDRDWKKLAQFIDVEHITSAYTAGQPDPDLVIRTSGEQRMYGFLLAERPQRVLLL